MPPVCIAYVERTGCLGPAPATRRRDPYPLQSRPPLPADMQNSNSELISGELLPALSAADIDTLAQAIDSSGVAVLRNVIPASMLAQAREYIAHELRQRSGQYFGFADRDWIG